MTFLGGAYHKSTIAAAPSVWRKNGGDSVKNRALETVPPMTVVSPCQGYVTFLTLSSCLSKSKDNTHTSLTGLLQTLH